MLQKVFFPVLGVLFLAACAPVANSPQNRSAATAAIQQVPLSHQQLRAQLAALPGIEVAPTEPLVASYPAGSLFAAAALLPMPGGVSVLDPLATFLRRSNLSWQLKVRAATGEGVEYDHQLAAARVQILQQYFAAAGVDLRRMLFRSVAEDGAPLELSINR